MVHGSGRSPNLEGESTLVLNVTAAAMAFLAGLALARVIPWPRAKAKWRGLVSPADFHILVMDVYADDDPHAWLYSASARSKAELLALACYPDPPKSLHKATFASVSRTRIKLACCSGGDPEGGTVHGMKHV